MDGRSLTGGGYRYGFNGQEKDDDAAKSSYTAEFWQYSPVIGRRWNVDPVVAEWESPYATFRNNPVLFNDPNGDCPTCNEKGATPSGQAFEYDGGQYTTISFQGTVHAIVNNQTYKSYFWNKGAKGYYDADGNRLAFNKASGISGGTWTVDRTSTYEDGRLVGASYPLTPDAKPRFNFTSVSGERYNAGNGWGGYGSVEAFASANQYDVPQLYQWAEVTMYGSAKGRFDFGDPSDYLKAAIPVMGSIERSYSDFQNGDYGSGLLNAGMAISDVFLFKSIATALKNGYWKTGSNTWSATRTWYGKTYGAEAGQPIHHWFFHRNQGIGKYIPDVIKNQPWNLLKVPKVGNMNYKQVHDAIHGWGGHKKSFLWRYYYGTPMWFKASKVSLATRLLTQNE